MSRHNTEDSGYLDTTYIQSLSGIGKPRLLTHSQGWILERSIAGTPYYDAMGTYPIFQCHNWQGLPDDLETLRSSQLVSLVITTDPMLDKRHHNIFRHFDIARQFKTHYLTDLEVPYEHAVSRHHRYYVRKAGKLLELDIPENPLLHVEEWYSLYSQLMKRHECNDIRNFSSKSFRQLLSMSGVTLFRALHKGETVGTQIAVKCSDTVHLHLAAFSEIGYKTGASYFLDATAIDYFRHHAQYINFGGGVGVSSGLTQYKQGWSTEQRMTYLLGANLSPYIYDELTVNYTESARNYFPLYREGEYHLTSKRAY